MTVPVDRTLSVPITRGESSPVGLHRVLEPSGDQITSVSYTHLTLPTKA